ncbi:MAG: glutamine amidotransferase [Acidobacteriota bacterium]|nr:glutamine amidotransferase [Acidobacteriota bacterium]
MARQELAAVKVALLFPELLGTYGDGGNARVLVERARRRDESVELAVVALHDALPEADLYLLGGGEDGPQRLARQLLDEGDLARRVADGAHLLAVCAGLQILGTTFCVEGDDEFPGLGLVDARTTRGETRTVGELAVDVAGRWLVGFENHGGRTSLGDGVAPLGTVVRGRGSDGRTDGFCTDRVWATYAHGPVLAMNPWFADEILSTVLGRRLEPIAGVAERLYLERCGALNLPRRG